MVVLLMRRFLQQHLWSLSSGLLVSFQHNELQVSLDAAKTFCPLT